MEVEFSDLLERSRALTASNGGAAGYNEGRFAAGGTRIPQLERKLEQIDRESRRLLNSKARDGAEDGGDGALRLLAEYGYEADKLERDLQSVALMDRLEPYESFDDNDLEAFIRHQHEMLILGAVEEMREKVLQDVFDADEAAIAQDWDSQRREILSLKRPLVAADEAPPTTTSNATFASPFRLLPQIRGRATSSTSTSVPPPASTLRRRADVLYTDVVKRAIQAQSSSGSVSFSAPGGAAAEGPGAVAGAGGGAGVQLAKELEKVARDERRGSEVEECFRIVKNIVHEDLGTCAWSLALTEPKPPSTEEAIQGALRFLCAQFLERKLRPTIASAPRVAKRGGDPSIEADVRSYLNVIFERGVPEPLMGGAVAHDLPLWPQLYYLLRCGFVKNAADLAARSAQGIESEGLHYHHFIREFSQDGGSSRLLSETTFGKLAQEYTTNVRRGTDPFRRVCYLLLARINTMNDDPLQLLEEDYGVLFPTIEDYLWFRLNIVRHDQEPPPPPSQGAQALRIGAVQEEVRDFGAAYFDPKGDRPFLYVQVLLLTLQFGEAVDQLARSPALDLTDATHLVFVLHAYGLLAEDDAPLDDSQLPKVGTYADLLWSYVKTFGKAYPRDATMYLFSLRETLWRHALLERLILFTGEFDAILGPSPDERLSGLTITPGGSLGALDELWAYGNEPEAMKFDLVASCASVAEAKGDRAIAADLFARSRRNDKVVEILLHMLSAELTSASDSPRRLEALRLARKFRMTRIDDRRLERSLYTLVQLCRFFDLKHASKFDLAWQELKDLAIFPLADDQLIGKSIEWKDGSRDLDEDVTDRVGDVLVAAMECLAELYSAERRRTREQGGQAARLEIKSYARMLVNFAGILQLPTDVSANIIRLEVLMS